MFGTNLRHFDEAILKGKVEAEMNKEEAILGIKYKLRRISHDEEAILGIKYKLR